jgi:hypothetical protein
MTPFYNGYKNEFQNKYGIRMTVDGMTFLLCCTRTSHVRTHVRTRTWLTFIALKWLFLLSETKQEITRFNAVLFISAHIRRYEHCSC